MSIKIYTLEQKEEWDAIVRTFADYDVYYLSGYVKAFQIHGDGEPILIYFQKQHTRAINVVIKRDLFDYEFFSNAVSPATYYDITTPYGYGGVLVEGNDLRSLQEEYESFCARESIVCEFVRFHPLLENWKGLDHLYEETHLGETVFMDTQNEDVIWKNMTSKNRNMIRKAQKSGLKVYWGRDPRLIEPFIEIYNATMKKDNAENYYYFSKEFYESVLEDLKQNSMWFYTKKEDDIVAIAIFMFCNGKMHYHLSASKKEYQNLAPSNLMLYEAAIWAANHGYKKLHMGGGVGSGHDSLYKFKKAFNRERDLEFYIGKKIFMKDKYMELCKLRRKIDPDFNENTKYFPAYRGERIDHVSDEGDHERM